MVTYPFHQGNRAASKDLKDGWICQYLSESSYCRYREVGLSNTFAYSVGVVTSKYFVDKN